MNDQQKQNDAEMIAKTNASPERHKTLRGGILIDDMEIAERWPDQAERLIAALDEDPETQKKETMWHGNRYRPAVEAKIKQLLG